MSEKKHPIVLRFATVFPAALARIEMHARRTGGPLDHVTLEYVGRNRVHVGPTFAKAMRAEISQMARENMQEEAAACRARKRPKEADACEERGPVPPWHGNSQGPIREAIVAAHHEYFEVDDWSDPDDILEMSGIGLGGETITRAMSVRKIAAFEEATVAFFDQFFPGSVRHLRLDLDEEAPHCHAVLMEVAEKTNKTRGRQRMIKPSQNPLLADYELAQDVAGQHFAAIGLVRGEKHAEAVRDARDSGLPLPDAVRHESPRAYREARAKAIREKETRLSERQERLDLRQAALSVDEIAIDHDRAEAAKSRTIAGVLERSAEATFAKAKKTIRDADAYMDAVSEGIDAVMDHRLDYREGEGDEPELVFVNPHKVETEGDRRSLMARIRPAYAKIVQLARRAFRMRAAREDILRQRAEAEAAARIVAAAEAAAGRASTAPLAAVLEGRPLGAFIAADFPGAWAVPAASDQKMIDVELDTLTNRDLRDRYAATLDATSITEAQPSLRQAFDRGERLIEFEAGRRGFDLETGRHDPAAATDPSRARLHQDQGVRPLAIKRKDRTPVQVRSG